MGDVENTILKYFQKEKITIVKIRFWIFRFGSLLSSNYQIHQIKISMKSRITQLQHQI
jgi:hypothetical protein